MNKGPFTRYDGKTRLSAADLNGRADLLEAVGRLKVAPPLEMIETPGGFLLSVNLEQTTQEENLYAVKITGLFNTTGGAWAGYETDGSIAFISAHFTFFDSTWEDDSVELYYIASGFWGKQPIGFNDLEVGKKVAVINGPMSIAVPGREGEEDEGAGFTGVVYPWVGLSAESPKTAPDFNLVAGQGICQEDIANPWCRKFHVDLPNASCGLCFTTTQNPDNAQLMVDADITHGTCLDANGVQTFLADDKPGLCYQAMGQGGGSGLSAFPDTAHAICKDTGGLRLFLGTELGLGFNQANGGLDVLYDTDRGLDADAQTKKLYAKIDTTKGLCFNAQGGEMAVFVDGDRGIAIDAQKGVYAKINTCKALCFNGSGEMEVRIDECYGLEIVSGAVRAKIGEEPGGLCWCNCCIVHADPNPEVSCTVKVVGHVCGCNLGYASSDGLHCFDQHGHFSRGDCHGTGICHCHAASYFCQAGFQLSMFANCIAFRADCNGHWVAVGHSYFDCLAQPPAWTCWTWCSLVPA
jgi:hypothetical protein